MDADALTSDDDTSDPETNANASNEAIWNAQQKPNKAQPLIPVVEQILPVLIPVAEKWAKDVDVMESLFSILKQTLATINGSSTLVIEYAMRLVLISFRIHPSPAAISLAKQVWLYYFVS